METEILLKRGGMASDKMSAAGRVRPSGAAYGDLDAAIVPAKQHPSARQRKKAWKSTSDG